ncbi:MAG: GNAT family N-acetyltransferase [Thermomicrobiales bacterium]
MDLIIRPAEPNDYDRFIADIDAWWGGRHLAAMLPRLFFTHFRPWTYVAEAAGAPVGFLTAFQSQSDPGQVYCHFIGVAPRSRGQGIGEALYRRLFVDAARRGCKEVLAVTSPGNRASVAFHLRLGFEALPGPRDAEGTPYTPAYDGPGEDRVQFRTSVG